MFSSSPLLPLRLLLLMLAATFTPRAVAATLTLSRQPGFDVYTPHASAIRQRHTAGGTQYRTLVATRCRMPAPPTPMF